MEFFLLSIRFRRMDLLSNSLLQKIKDLFGSITVSLFEILDVI